MRQQSADTRLRQTVVLLFVPAKKERSKKRKKRRAMDTFALDLNRHPYSLSAPKELRREHVDCVCGGSVRRRSSK